MRCARSSISPLRRQKPSENTEAFAITRSSRRRGNPEEKMLQKIVCKRSWSGCWESNPDYKTPSLAYYHYTTPRAPYCMRRDSKTQIVFSFFEVILPREQTKHSGHHLRAPRRTSHLLVRESYVFSSPSLPVRSLPSV